MRKILNITVPNSEHWDDLLALFLHLDDHDEVPHPYWYDEQIEPLINKIGRKVYTDFVESCVNAMEKKYLDGLSFGYNDGYTNTSFLKSSRIEEFREEFNKSVAIELDHSATKAVKSQFYFTYTLEGRIFKGIFHSIALIYNEKLIDFVKKITLKNREFYIDTLHLLSLLPINSSLPILKSVNPHFTTKREQNYYSNILREISIRTKIPLATIKQLA